MCVLYFCFAYCSTGTLLAHGEKNFQMECEYKTTKHNLYYHYTSNDTTTITMIWMLFFFYLLSRDPFCYLFSDKCKLSLLLALTSRLMNELVDLQHLQNFFFFPFFKSKWLKSISFSGNKTRRSRWRVMASV